MGTMEDFMLPPHVASEENIGTESDVHVCQISKKTPNPNPNPETGNNPQPTKRRTNWHRNKEQENKKKEMPGISGKKRFISMIDKSQKILINAFPMSLIFSQIYAFSVQSLFMPNMRLCGVHRCHGGVGRGSENMGGWCDGWARDGGSSAKLCAFTMVDNANVNPYTPRQS